MRLLTALVFGFALALPAQEPGAASRTSRPTRPNFVFVLLEGTGFGWSSTSVAMDDRVPQAKVAPALTPNLARLAAAGMRFSDFYVSAPRCTPARATFLTGIGAAKLGMTYVNEGGAGRERPEGRGKKGGEEASDAGPHKLLTPTSRTELPSDVATIADVLHGAGYATAHFGKWHVGRLPPARHGFDVHDGANNNQGPGNAGKPNPEQGIAITERGIAFAKQQVAAGKPFYLQLSHYGGGSEDESRAETRQALAAELRGMRPKAANSAAILADIDQQLGRLLAALDELGIANSTYVVLSFDHGAAGRGSNAPLTAGKGSVLEGGIRVPFLVRGPGVRAGACTHVRASGADLLPTLADLAGVHELRNPVEGSSLVSVLRDDGPVKRPREELVVHFPHYDLGNGGPASALFLGEYKLVRRYEDGARMLYRVATDPGEQHDLAAKEPERLADLTRRLDAYLTAIAAGMPKPNPEFGKK